MISFRIGGFGKGSAWLNDRAGAQLPDVECETLRLTSIAEHSPLSVHSVTFEINIGRGGVISYGLLGIEFNPDPTLKQLVVEVPDNRFKSDRARTSPNVPSCEFATCGLLPEFIPSIVETITAAATSKFSSGRLRISEAACGSVGSSPNIFIQLTLRCIEVLLAPPCAAAELVERVAHGFR